jgi:SPOR domain
MSGPPGDFEGPPPPPPPDDTAAAATAETPSGPAPPVCPRCGAPHDPFQEYCLECGQRLTPRPSGSLWRRETWTRDSPFWFWAAFLGLLAIALITGAIVLAATGEEEGAPSTAPGTTLLTDPTTGLTTEALPTTVQPPTFSTTTDLTSTFPTTTGLTTTGLTTTGSTTTGTGTTTTTTTTTTTSGSTATWPAGRTAYTVIVGSFRESRGRAPAETRATQARSAGLTQVGILRSSDFSSLRSGWYAVFTGIFDSRSQATTRLTEARRTYPTAYLRYVQP